MIPSELLRKKRDGQELSPDELNFLLRGIVDGSISEAQAAAFLMAACTRGLSAKETGVLTLGMSDSGRKYSFRELGRPVIDKHSTGGVGDKISLLLVPIVACCDIAVPMMSGRGLGHTGGTVDKLESIPGFRMNFSDTELLGLLRSNSCFMIKASDEVAPADRILYALRDVTGTIESTSLICASILSKKLVEDLDALILDMKVGRGAFMSTREQANELATSMLSVATEVSLPMRIIFSRMDNPLGRAVGNWLEMQETEQCLADFESTPSDLKELTCVQAMRMLQMADPRLDDTAARNKVEHVWRSGQAHERFHRLISAQGGNWQRAQETCSASKKRIIRAPHSGIIQNARTREIGLAAIELGAGRKRHDDLIDFAAGFRFFKRPGDSIEKGEEWYSIEATSEVAIERVEPLMRECLQIAETPFEETDLIIDEWDNLHK